MSVKTTTVGETDLPRYFVQVFQTVSKLKNGRLEFHLPDGRIFRAEGTNPGPLGICEVHDLDVFARLIREGDLGFCDAYLEGGWSTPDLQALMDAVHADNDEVYDGFLGMALVRAYEKLRFWMQGNSKRQAKKNISYHYDLGNDFYSLWLDDTMTYSSALFETGQESTEAAQRAKYAALADKIGVKPGDHLLEIGCGWGGFAEYAAKERGARITGLTISREQHDYAVARMERQGLSDRVEIRMQDYRETEGQFDGIASIEMFEAVGEKYWPVFFSTVRDRLKPGAVAALQIITVQDARWQVYKRGVDFIQKYIFPGGMLPCPSVLRQQVEAAGLQFSGSHEFGESYSQTLRRWHETFNERWDDVAAQGFDDRFRRMWNFYLTSCAASFHSGNTDVTQISVTRPG
ncbi:SAM-dependent methyltransferase [Nioella sediminis]|jgi:cyclopropane-fatty-acyl-phospholipid synthase|uniref:SAM-dependent methyltransferase n=1 Tax=Nioella sediminis TaxID=1912092 RepID=UPI0008FD32FD|nr:cyclopropane-fatty-acyl-phospholipid synthase family protein [Nioella sediminis]TBX28196.1 cyclopropane-fatty-acyl-phospholipid synthase [Roseovarius sp. JS7-11]